MLVFLCALTYIYVIPVRMSWLIPSTEMMAFAIPRPWTSLTMPLIPRCTCTEEVFRGQQRGSRNNYIEIQTTFGVEGTPKHFSKTILLMDDTMPRKSIHPPWMFSSFVAFIHEITVHIIWLFWQEFAKKILFCVKVKTDFYKLMSTNQKYIVQNNCLHKYLPHLKWMTEFNN